MSQYRYDDEFFAYVNASAGKSARLFIDRLQSEVLVKEPGTILDVGCGQGLWLREWKRRTGAVVLGIDGTYVDRKSVLVAPDEFLAKDISKPFHLERRFDLVQCLEVAEHVPGSAAETLVENLVRHGDVIVFSAATPGQGGEFHVNEQPPAYWQRKFAAYGYDLYDAIRPRILHLRDIEPWYRYNAFVLANATGASRLAAPAAAALVRARDRIPTVAPLTWRMRCYLTSLLPAGVTLQLARTKHRLINAAATRGRAQ